MRLGDRRSCWSFSVEIWEPEWLGPRSAPWGREEDARVTRRLRGSWPSARGSLVEVGQIEELEAPVALDRAVDEDHVVHCGAGPVSATGPATAPSHPAPAGRPLAPPGTNKKKPGTKKMALETPVGADGVGSGQGGVGRANGHCLG